MLNCADYYDRNADRFFNETVDVDMSLLYDRFLATIPNGGLILDAGCGSGRDTKAFAARGYRVTAFDASTKLAQKAAEHTGQPVAVRDFLEITEESYYDGIWACASLLHLPEQDVPDTVARLWRALKSGGVFYLSFKLGDGERIHDGRHFTDATDARLRNWIGSLPELKAIETWITSDQRPGRDEQWLNALVRRNTCSHEKLVTGGNHPFLPHLRDAITRADEIDMAVAFIKVTGLRLLLPDLQAAISTESARSRRPARLRIVTSDYLDVTDPEALRLLMLLQEQGAQVRVFEATTSSFHMKAYLFAHFINDGQHGQRMSGTGFIGSSNISRQALKDGLEWNYRIDYPGDNGFLEARARFETLFHDPRAIELDDAWIDRYEARRIAPPRAVAPGSEETEPPPTPTPVQIEALEALAATRREGYRRGLVVLATGLGRTWLAPFDADMFGARRVLFVAHREEILNQAAETFLRMRPHARVGFYMGQTRDSQVDVMCASVQTLSRVAHLERFSAQHFDYIIIDEFHHAAAATYRRRTRYGASQARPEPTSSLSRARNRNAPNSHSSPIFASPAATSRQARPTPKNIAASAPAMVVWTPHATSSPAPRAIR